MGNKDPRIDAYIEKAQPFAKPVLKHVRQLIHNAVPEVHETIKWSSPFFDHHGALIGLAAFKNHLHVLFWKYKLMSDPAGLLCNEDCMGRIGMITSMDDLPPSKMLLRYIREAALLNEKGVKLSPRNYTSERKQLEAPDFLVAALKRNKNAREVFEAFSYSHKKEYIMWLTDAKTEETRKKRLAIALEWMAEGKSRNWKYQRKK